MIPQNPLIEEDDPFIWGLVIYMAIGAFVWLVTVGLYFVAKALLTEPWMYLRGAGWAVGTLILLVTVGALTVHTARIIWVMWRSGDADERGEAA